MEEIIKYYSNLLIVQYNEKPKAKATVKLLIELMYANFIFLQIQNAFNWKEAQGEPLDFIGKWVGVDKFYNGQLFYFHPWFSLIDWNSTPDGTQGGFSTFETFDNNDGGFLTYEDILPTQNQLSADNFRLMIGLKIIKNNINHTAKEIDEAIWNYFNGQVYTVWDLENRKLIYYYPKSLDVVVEVAAYKNVLPCPPTVSIELQEIIDD